ncbi:unnamed protein product, partial [Symbiodinium microadriaticum]
GTHDKIDEKAFLEWSLVMAKNAQDFMLLQEKSPLCMLPPPLNLIPSLLYATHNGYISLACRARDWDERKRSKKSVEKAQSVLNRSKAVGTVQAVNVLALLYERVTTVAPKVNVDSEYHNSTYEVASQKIAGVVDDKRHLVSIAGTACQWIIGLGVLPFITLGAIPLRTVEFIVKYTRTNRIHTWPYGLLMALPYVTLLTVIFGCRSIYIVFAHPCYLIQRRHNNKNKRLDVDHNADWIRHHWLTSKHFKNSDRKALEKAGVGGAEKTLKQARSALLSNQKWFSSEDFKNVFGPHLPDVYPHDTTDIDAKMMKKLDALLQAAGLHHLVTPSSPLSRESTPR